MDSSFETNKVVYFLTLIYILLVKTMVKVWPEIRSHKMYHNFTI